MGGALTVWTKTNKFKKRAFTAVILLLTVLLLVIGADSALPYCKDVFADSKTVTTDSYIVIRDNLSFRDETGTEVTLKIPKETAEEYRARTNYDYDSTSNLLKYSEPITIKYFPNSGVLLGK